jgi:hypothetical protein
MPIGGISYCHVTGEVESLLGVPAANVPVQFALAAGPVSWLGASATIAAQSTTTDAAGQWSADLPYSEFLIMAQGQHMGDQSGVRITIPTAGISKAVYIESQVTAMWDTLPKLDWSR